MEQFFKERNVEQHLGDSIATSKLKNGSLDRVLDRLSDVGTNTILKSMAIKAMKSFELDLSTP